MRESNRQLDIFGAALDEVLAMAELELCRQRRKRLETKYQQIAENVGNKRDRNYEVKSCQC